MRLRVQMAGRMQRRAALPGSNFNTLDGQVLQIRSRVFRIEHLAVEEGLLAARGRGRDFGSGNAELLGGLLPEILTVDLADQRLRVEAGFVLAPADILGEEPEVMALERIGGVVAPVLHDVRAVFDHFTGNSVVELARRTVVNVLDRAI